MRSLEDHLSPQELVSLPESREILARGGDEQQRLLQHLESCDSCGALANVRWTVKGLAGSTMASEENCPETDAWLEFAAGLRQDDSAEMLRHAARCGRCAADLKEALELMLPSQVDNATAPSGSPVEGLASNSSEWQSVMAARMAAGASANNHGPPHAVSESKARRRWPKLSVWLAIPVATALAAIAILGLWHWVHPSDARLLALAYNKQRILVLRIPGALPVPMASGTRGSTNGLAEPSELLELRLRTQKHLDQTPNSPYWHQILGEINLLEGEGESARRNLEIAQTSDDKLPNLKNDLAAAWFEMGDETGNAEDYAEAAELYSQQIHSHSADSSLLYFNRAICWERQNLNQQAEDDLRAALAAERSTAWRRAIQDELSRLSAHSALPADDYEMALDQAIKGLLPHWSAESAQDRDTIVRVAQSGLRHHDRWLLDWITAPHSSVSAEADQHLARSLSAADRGEARASLNEAQIAARQYREAHHRPGLIRALLAQTYAMQRLGRARDCLDLAAQVAGQPHITEYSSVGDQSLLQDAICTGRNGDYAATQSLLTKDLTLVEQSSLPQLEINLLSMQISLFRRKGMYLAAWKEGTSTLGLCAQIQCPPGREYKLLYEMVGDAEDLGLPFTALQLMNSAAGISAGSDDVITRAYALETLGVVSGRADDFDLSAHAFAEAARVGSSSGNDAMVALYQAEWQVDRAEMLSRSGKPLQALGALEKSAPPILASDYQLGRVSYFDQLSIAQLAVGRSTDALASSIAATREAERSLVSLKSMDERLQWTRENAPIYWQLILVYLRRGEQTAALQAWERYRSAPYLSVSHTASRSVNVTGAHHVIVLARIDNFYIGWLASPSPLHALKTVILGDRSHLETAANTLYRLCADRNSRIADISNLGSRLYLDLLEPLAPQQQPRALWIDLDPSLSMVPISALTLPGGQWLGELTQVTVLPPWWSVNPSSALEQERVSPSARFLAIDGFDPSQAGASEASGIASLFPSSVIMSALSGSPNEILNAIRAADIFHFSGHATSTSQARLLLSSATAGTTEFLSPDSFGNVHLPRCRLAVLAACNTTAADPDQIEKLPDMRNALLLSGAQAAVASDWDVDDRSTNTLMLGFYHQLLSGAPVAEALRIAEQSVRSSAAWQHPFYWAAFEVFTR